MKKIIVGLVGLLSALYLVFPSFATLEIIPDWLPFIGSIDEATATMLLLWALRYFGIDPTRWFQDEEKKKDEQLESS